MCYGKVLNTFDDYIIDSMCKILCNNDGIINGGDNEVNYSHKFSERNSKCFFFSSNYFA